MVFPPRSCVIASFPLKIRGIPKAETCLSFFRLSGGGECRLLDPALGPGSELSGSRSGLHSLFLPAPLPAPPPPKEFRPHPWLTEPGDGSVLRDSFYLRMRVGEGKYFKSPFMRDVPPRRVLS